MFNSALQDKRKSYGTAIYYKKQTTKLYKIAKIKEINKTETKIGIVLAILNKRNQCQRLASAIRRDFIAQISYIGTVDPI